MKEQPYKKNLISQSKQANNVKGLKHAIRDNNSIKLTSKDNSTNPLWQVRRILKKFKLGIIAISKLFTRYFIISIAWGAGISALILFVGLILSGNTVLYRGTTFNFQPKWKFTKVVNSKNNKVKQKQVNKILNGWMVESVSTLFEPLSNRDLKQIAIVKMNGTIMPSCYSHNVICPDVLEDLTDYLRNNEKIKGVVILLNSPGGEVYSSEAIYHALKDLSRVKPVYIYIESEDASGAYYISMGATKIYASPVSIIGSIGVYMEVFNYDGLLQKLGIRHKYIVSQNAKYKLANEWLFNDSTEGKQVQSAIQDVINATEKVFWNRVHENRPQVQLSDLQGLIFPSAKAKQLGLIDGIEDQPVNVVADMLNEQGFNDNKYVIVEYSLNHLGPYKGVSASLRRITEVLSGSSEHYLMWK